MQIFKILGTIAVEDKEARDAIANVRDEAGSASNSMSESFKKIGTAVAAAFAIDKIIDFGKEIVNVAATVAAEQSAFAQIMGDFSDEASAKVAKIADATGMVDTRLTPYMTSMTAKFKGLGYDIDDATSFASRGLNLAADASAFWDKSLDESMSHLNSFINGSYEGGEAIGLFANDTQMAAYAVQQGIVPTTAAWASLDEATKQATRLEYAENMMKMSGATGQAAKESEQYANVQANLTEKWRQFKAQIGEPLLQNVVLPAMEKLSELVDVASQKFEELKTWIAENKDTIEKWKEGLTTAFTIITPLLLGLVAGFTAYKAAVAIGTVVTKAQTLAQVAQALATGSLTKAQIAAKLAQAGLNAAMLMSPITWVVAGIVALVAAFVLLWNKSEGFRNFWIALWDGIKKTAKAVADWFVQTWEGIGIFFTKTVPGWFNSFKNFFVELWGSISNFFSGVWETIKNVVQVGLMFIGSLISAAFNIITLPFRFIWENCKDTIIAVWNAITTFLTNIFEAIKTRIVNAFDFYKNIIVTVFNAVKSFIISVWTAIVEFLTPIFEGIKNAVSNTWNSIKTTVTTVLNAIKTTVSNIWNGIKTGMSNVINGIKTVVSNAWSSISSTTSNVFNAVKSKVSSIWNGVKSAIETPINKARDTVKAALDRIKSFFDNLKLKFPNIKLPHFSITGKFSIAPPSVPRLSIDWYKKAMDNAMLLNSPTIFGMNPAGQFMGGGEAGQEVVAGSNTLMNMIRSAVKEESSANNYLPQLMAMLENYLGELVERSDKNIVLDDDTLVGRMTSKIDVNMGNLNKLKARGI